MTGSCSHIVQPSVISHGCEAEAKQAGVAGVLMIFADETREKKGGGSHLTGLTRPDQANYLPWNNNSCRDGDWLN